MLGRIWHAKITKTINDWSTQLFEHTFLLKRAAQKIINMLSVLNSPINTDPILDEKYIFSKNELDIAPKREQNVRMNENFIIDFLLFVFAHLSNTSIPDKLDNLPKM